MLESEHLPHHVAFLQGGHIMSLREGRGSGGTFRTVFSETDVFLVQQPRVHKADPELTDGGPCADITALTFSLMEPDPPPPGAPPVPLSTTQICFQMQNK